MSRAFVKEPDGDAAEPLPDRPLSPHPNLVTLHGLALIEEALTAAQRAQAEAGDDRGALARSLRELRYWSARRSSAQVVPQSPTDAVCFGCRVTILRADGRRQTFRIVGEDEADPAKGSISYVAPLARALLGRRVGDVVEAGNSEAEVVDVA
jgi:transcription elongation GreA/GreB family factor